MFLIAALIFLYSYARLPLYIFPLYKQSYKWAKCITVSYAK